VPSASAIQQAGAPSSSRAGAKAGAILEAGALAGSDAEEEQQKDQEEEAGGAGTAGGCCDRPGTWPLCAHIHQCLLGSKRTGHMCCTAASKQSWHCTAAVLSMAALLFDPVALSYMWYASVHALYRRCC
jgi:hypothetical protein